MNDDNSESLDIINLKSDIYSSILKEKMSLKVDYIDKKMNYEFKRNIYLSLIIVLLLISLVNIVFYIKIFPTGILMTGVGLLTIKVSVQLKLNEYNKKVNDAQVSYLKELYFETLEKYNGAILEYNETLESITEKSIDNFDIRNLDNILLNYSNKSDDINIVKEIYLFKLKQELLLIQDFINNKISYIDLYDNKELEGYLRNKREFNDEQIIFLTNLISEELEKGMSRTREMN